MLEINNIIIKYHGDTEHEGDKEFIALVNSVIMPTTDDEHRKAKIVAIVDNTDWSNEDKVLALKFARSLLYGWGTYTKVSFYCNLLDTNISRDILGVETIDRTDDKVKEIETQLRNQVDIYNIIKDKSL